MSGTRIFGSAIQGKLCSPIALFSRYAFTRDQCVTRQPIEMETPAFLDTILKGTTEKGKRNRPLTRREDAVNRNKETNEKHNARNNLDVPFKNKRFFETDFFVLSFTPSVGCTARGMKKVGEVGGGWLGGAPPAARSKHLSRRKSISAADTSAG